MRILAVLKHVPDSRASITVKADGTGIETGGVKFVCDPFDEFAIAQASHLKETRSDVEEVHVVTSGPNSAAEVLRTGLAMGADLGIHICDDDVPIHNELLIAELIAAAIRHRQIPYDLILCGKQTIDTDAGEFGPALAEFLDLPHVGAIVSLELATDASTARVHRRIEGAEETVETPLPALMTCEKGLVEPRPPSLPNVMKARKKPIETLSLADLDGMSEAAGQLTFIKLESLPPNPPCRMIEGKPEEIASELVRLLHTDAKVI